MHRIAGVLSTCPGLGPIRTTRLLSIVVTPHRFRTRQWLRAGAPREHSWAPGALGLAGTQGRTSETHRLRRRARSGAAGDGATRLSAASRYAARRLPGGHLPGSQARLHHAEQIGRVIEWSED
jgi:hypothetical protein